LARSAVTEASGDLLVEIGHLPTSSEDGEAALPEGGQCPFHLDLRIGWGGIPGGARESHRTLSHLRPDLLVKQVMAIQCLSHGHCGLSSRVLANLLLDGTPDQLAHGQRVNRELEQDGRQPRRPGRRR